MRSKADFDIWWGLPAGKFDGVPWPRDHEHEPLARTDLTLLRSTTDGPNRHMTRRELTREHAVFKKSENVERKEAWPVLMPAGVFKLSRSELLSLVERNRHRDFHHATIGRPSPASITRASAIGCCWVSRATSTGRARPAVAPARTWGRHLGANATCQTRIDWLSTVQTAGWLHLVPLPLLRDRRRRGGRLPDQHTAPPALATIQRRRLVGRRAPASNTSSPTRSAPSSNISTSIWARSAARRVRSAVRQIALPMSRLPAAQCPSPKT